jgi:tetratricopeptide (TPR) repeat protein
MKKNVPFFIVYFLLLSVASIAQDDPNQLEQTAKSFMLQGDYSNSVLILNRAMKLDPQNLEIIKDLALTYYLQKDNNDALQTIKPVLDRDDADDQCFQIAGNIYQALNMNKDCEKLYLKGIKKFPEDGVLYNEYGELLWNEQDDNSIKQWEKGIEVDPSYSKNYYNACRYYHFGGDKVWTILYGEIFLNMEPLSNRTPEIKGILLETYKKLFTDADITKNNKDKNKFVEAFLETMNKETNVAAAGLNPESLTMIRTRFILDWFNDYGDKFPFRLFDFQRQLLQEGMFDAYNQWIFGTVQNLAAYQNWINTHSTEYDAFEHFQTGRIFKLPAGQYYK